MKVRFNCLWRNRSTKKNKSWQDDGFIVIDTETRLIQLIGSDGKRVIGSCNGKNMKFPWSQIESLADESDRIISVGEKEIQITGLSNENQPIQEVDLSINSNLMPVKKSVGRKPLLSSCTVGSGKPLKRKFSETTGKDYIMLPRPSTQEFFRKRDGKMSKLQDVVIDPFLASVLRPHQIEGIKFLYEAVMGFKTDDGEGAILADEMGLGKTLQIIGLIWILLSDSCVVRKALIVCPASLVSNWQKEFYKWLSKNRISVSTVDANTNLNVFALNKSIPVLIIGYERLVSMAEQIQKMSFDIVVCDEGHRLKNSQIKLNNVLCGLKTKRRILVSGTPIQNDLMEFYTTVDFVNPGILGSSSDFKREYEDCIVASRQPEADQDLRERGLGQLKKLISLSQSFILRRNHSVNEKYLPPKKEFIVFIKPSPIQLQMYREALDSLEVQDMLERTKKCIGGGPLQMLNILSKICSAPSILKDSDLSSLSNGNQLEKLSYQAESKLYDCNSKLRLTSVLLRKFRADEEKTVLVSNSTKVLDILEKMCMSLSVSHVRLDGSTASNKRQELVEEFNRPTSSLSVFLLSSKAGGVGLNLIGASNIILFDISWNPSTDLQAMARIWRDGQKKTAMIYRLILSGTLDEKMFQRQLTKTGLSNSIIDESEKDLVNQFCLADLRDLFTLDEESLCQTGFLLNKDDDCEEPNEPNEALNSDSESSSTDSLNMFSPQKQTPKPSSISNEWKIDLDDPLQLLEKNKHLHDITSGGHGLELSIWYRGA